MGGHGSGRRPNFVKAFTPSNGVGSFSKGEDIVLQDYSGAKRHLEQNKAFVKTTGDTMTGNLRNETGIDMGISQFSAGEMPLITFNPYFATHTANPNKIRLFSNLYGFGVSAGSLNYTADTGADHTFYNSTDKSFTIEGTSGGAHDAHNRKIQNVKNPTADKDASNKLYVDANLPYFGYRSDAYYHPYMAEMIPATQGALANFVYYSSPHYMQSNSDTDPIDRIAIEVTTASTGSTNLCRIGVYSNVEGHPYALLLNAGTVSTATTGVKEITGLSFGTSPATFFIALLASDAFTYRAYGNVAIGNPVLSLTGTNSFGNLVFTLFESRSYSSNFPSTATPLYAGSNLPPLTSVRYPV